MMTGIAFAIGVFVVLLWRITCAVSEMRNTMNEIFKHTHMMQHCIRQTYINSGRMDP